MSYTFFAPFSDLNRQTNLSSTIDPHALEYNEQQNALTQNATRRARTPQCVTLSRKVCYNHYFYFNALKIPSPLVTLFWKHNILFLFSYHWTLLCIVKEVQDMQRDQVIRNKFHRRTQFTINFYGQISPIALKKNFNISTILSLLAMFDPCLSICHAYRSEKSERSSWKHTGSVYSLEQAFTVDLQASFGSFQITNACM